jgi:hypothetical protein
MCKSKSGKFFLLLGVEHKPKKWNKKKEEARSGTRKNHRHFN